MNYIRFFNDIRYNDTALVGGKNASLGEMTRELTSLGILVPPGFAITADAYRLFIAQNKLENQIRSILEATNIEDPHQLKASGAHIRALIFQAHMPQEVQAEIEHAYNQLQQMCATVNLDVAVRSSATAEDLPGASFAGQQETFLHVRGVKSLLMHCKKSYASLFTDRAIVYRARQGFDHTQVALSVGVQKMVRSDLGCSGVAFSLDTETGFPDVVIINSSYGLGESIVQGMVNPDEFWVHKPTLSAGFDSIIKKRLGNKTVKIVYDQHEGVRQVPVDQVIADRFSLADHEVLSLSRSVLAIEQHYTALKGSWSPMDVEWAKDGQDGKIYIVQARPETIFGSRKGPRIQVQYRITQQRPAPLARGQSIGSSIASGVVRVIGSAEEIAKVQPGDIIVTKMTDPDWVPAMKKAAGIITTLGGRTCHAAIVSRELGIPAIVGASGVHEKVHTGMEITLDCSQGATGFIYPGKLAIEKEEIVLGDLPQVPVQLLLNLADPDAAFAHSFLPVDGVGLARVEFIITNVIKIHPLALVHPERIHDAATHKQIDLLTHGYQDKKDYFVDKLSQGVACLAAAFYPRRVIVRFSDFKSNEYRNLIGGSLFEPVEENPMIGWRGASRYYDQQFIKAFELECQAMHRVRTVMGLTNVDLMIPFVRTVQEARQVADLLAQNGLVQGENGLRYIMMTEVPSNVILIDSFAQIFDGFSIGSNDLTQLTLGVDRDSSLIAHLFNEKDPAVTKMIELAIQGAHRAKKTIGICGQAPSDYPDFGHWLIEQGIDSLSLNPDAIIPFIMTFK